MIQVVKIAFASAFLVVFLSGIARSDDFKTIDGREYKNVTVSRVEPDGIVLITSSGISKVYFAELPGDVQERFHYDAAKAATFSAEQAANQEALWKQRQGLQQTLAEEREKYWKEHPTPQPLQQSSYLTGSALDRPAYNQSTTAEFMLSRYAANQIAADKEYKGRIFTISGTIRRISSSHGDVAVELVAPSHSARTGGALKLKGKVHLMRCVFNDSRRLEQFQSGNPISLTGTVEGISGHTLIIKDCHF